MTSSCNDEDEDLIDDIPPHPFLTDIVVETLKVQRQKIACIGKPKYKYVQNIQTFTYDKS